VRRLMVIVLMAQVAACEGHRTTSEPADFPVRFLVSNALLAPVTIAVDGTPYLILTSGRSAGLTVSSTARWLTWTSAKPTDSDARPIPDDIGEVRISVAGLAAALEIDNVIDGQTYVTAGIFNPTNARLFIGVSNGSTVSCAGDLPAAGSGGSGFVQIGYYRLLPATQVRAYRGASPCTGEYVSWPSSELAGFRAKSGVLTLSVETAR
jgi:hypothetical protein